MRLLILLLLFSVGVQAQFKTVVTPSASAPVNDDILQRKSNQWVPRTLAQLTADLGITAFDSSTIYSVLATKQNLNTHLTSISGLTPLNDNILQYKSGAWTHRTMANLRSDLLINNVDNTTDLNKPISTLTQAALDLKVNQSTTVNGHALYSNISLVNTDIAEDGTHRWTTDAEKSTWNAKQSAITLGTTAQYFRGDLSLATFPTSNTSFTNGAGYLIASDITGKENSSNKDATGGYVGMTLFKHNFRNAANTFTSFLTNSNTAARTYTFQDRDGTIADNTDLALKSNLAGGNTITGLQTFTHSAAHVLKAVGANDIIGFSLQTNGSLERGAFTLNHNSGELKIYAGSSYFPVIYSNNAAALSFATSGAGTFAANARAASFTVGVASPDASAIVDFTSTTKGFLAPRMTTAQRNAITPVEGLIVYDNTEHKYSQYNGTLWNYLQAETTPAKEINIPWTGMYNQIGNYASTGTAPVAQVVDPASTIGMAYGSELGTGTTTTGGAVVFMKGATTLTSGRGATIPSSFTKLEVEQKIYIPTLSNGTETFLVTLGFQQISSAATNAVSTDGVYANIVDGTMSLIGRASSANTAGGSTFTVVAATAYKVKVVWTPGTNAQLYVNDVLITTLSTGLPSTSAQYQPTVQIYKTAGTTSRSVYTGMGYFKGTL